MIGRPVTNSRLSKCKTSSQCNGITDKTQNKKIIRYLNKQNFCVSYMDVGRQNNKWENNLLDGESGTTPLLKGVSKHSSIDNVDEQCESISLHFDKR